jgi:glycosyltransferase involved in cell wall biosynthesis
VRICFFDWVHRAHHGLYLRRFVEACESQVDVVVAAPDEAFESLRDLPIEELRLGSSRPAVAEWRPFASERRSILSQEARLIEQAAREARPDHMVHLYADQVLPHLMRRRTFAAPVSVLLFYPRAHYPAAFGTRLPPKELARARARELIISAWRRRPDAHALLTLDEEAARRWALRGGAPAFWIPEPPVVASTTHIGLHDRFGCVVYGAIAPRKGIHLLAQAVSVAPTRTSITIAGEVAPSFEPALQEHVAEMRRSGAEVEVRADRHSESQGLEVLARARCAVLPYPHHDGMSRVLLEACSVGTPVIAHDRGLVGYLVRRHQLGRSVDCNDPHALRQAILDLTTDDQSEAHADRLADFASRFSTKRFQEAVLAPFLNRTERASTARMALGEGRLSQ